VDRTYKGLCSHRAYIFVGEADSVQGNRNKCQVVIRVRGKEPLRGLRAQGMVEVLLGLSA
jgi:hypothetical protein